MDRFKNFALASFGICSLAVAVSAICFAVVAIKVWPMLADGRLIVSRVNKATVPMLECTYWDDKAKIQRGNPNCLPSSIAATTGAIKDMAGVFDKASKTLTPKVEAAADNSVLASKKTTELMEQGKGIAENVNGAVTDGRRTIVELTATLLSLHNTVDGISKDVDAMLKSGDSVLKATLEPLRELSELEQKLGALIDKTGPEALAIMKAIQDRVSDENITKILANIEAGTKSGSEILKTMDIVTEPFRKKIALVKAIISKLVSIATGVIHFNF